jgi:hypothetical protein
MNCDVRFRGQARTSIIANLRTDGNFTHLNSVPELGVKWHNGDKFSGENEITVLGLTQNTMQKLV